MPNLCCTQHPDSRWHAAAGESCLFTQVQQLRDDSASDEQVVLAMTEVLGPWPLNEGYVDHVRSTCTALQLDLHEGQGSVICSSCTPY